MDRPTSRLGLRAFLLALVCAGCSGLEPEEEQMLGIHKEHSQLYWERGDLDRAEQQCRLGLELEPSDRALRLTLAYVLLRKGLPAQLDEAEKLLDGLGGPHSDDFRVHLGRGLLHVARYRALQDRDAQAATELIARSHADMERVVTLEPDCTEAHYHLALLDLEQGRPDEFLRHAEDTLSRIERSVKLKDRQLEAGVRNDRRRILERDRAVDVQRGRELLRIQAERAYAEERFEEALAAMDRLEGLAALGRPDYFNRAQILEKLGRTERAVGDYERFLQKSEDGLDARVEVALENLLELRARLAEERTGSTRGP